MTEEKKEVSKVRLFFRILKECFQRSVTPYVMYLFMSLLLLSAQVIPLTELRLILSFVCIVIGAAYNAHLAYNYGATHFDSYMAGCLHRQNRAFGIPSGGDHREEKEYRPWKGFLIGLFTSLPVLFFGFLAGAAPQAKGIIYVLYVLFAGCAIIPVGWLHEFLGIDVSGYFSMLGAIVPILVTGIFYIIGAKKQERKKAEMAERMENVRNAGKNKKK